MMNAVAVPSMVAESATATHPSIGPKVAGAVTPIAVLGDSDSQGYGDTIWTPDRRGGEYAPSTFQWTEILAQLRGHALDFGDTAVWGQRRSLVSLMNLVGADARAPRKRDQRHNFAFAGARCDDLMSGVFRQAPRLVTLMNEAPERWRHGVVVVRIGIVSFGYADSLERLAKHPADEVVRGKMQACTKNIELALALVRHHHPDTRFVLVGILNNADYPPYLPYWQTAGEMANINAGLDYFDDSLRQLAAKFPGTTFFDDRAWFNRTWGTRAAHGGLPDYQPVTLGHKLTVNFSQGDAPTNAVLSDGHAGTVWNALWAQAMVAVLRSSVGVAVEPISDEEVMRYLTSIWPTDRLPPHP